MISVTILTKNASETLSATLLSLARFPQILLYDTGSSDKTLELAATYPNVDIVQGSFSGFGPSHNEASSLALYDWILSIDSDEVLSPQLVEEILTLSLDETHVYKINRHNYFNGKHIRFCSGWYPDWVTRLYHRKRTRFSDDPVHERISTEGLSPICLQGALLHTPYRSVEDFLTKMQLYSTLFAEQYRGKRRSSCGIAVAHAFVALCKNLFLKGGIFGGKEGWILSFYYGHITYYKYLKLYFLNQRK
jgi:glycosyltransferase involved in cell wall biosynthesis